jgi:DNA polymerase-3 subunit delta'
MVANERIYPWQGEQWRQLQGARRAGRMGHAWLVTGPGETGIRVFAEAWAQSLLCAAADGPCGDCRGCRLYTAGTHPDAVWLEPTETGRAISVEAVRGLCQRLELKGEDATKVAIIDPADALTTAGANSLLKTLEEPAGGACLLLVSRRASRLPATVRSRCHRTTFGIPDAATASAWLQEHGVANAAHWLALAGDRPLLAQRLATDEGDEAAGEEVVTAVLATLASGTVPASAEVVAKRPLASTVPALTATIEDLLRLVHAPHRARLRRPHWRQRMEALVGRLDAAALFDYLDRAYRSVPGPSSSLRSDSQFLGLLADAAEVARQVPTRARG